jgi:hypothetical protein
MEDFLKHCDFSFVYTDNQPVVENNKKRERQCQKKEDNEKEIGEKMWSDK